MRKKKRKRERELLKYRDREIIVIIEETPEEGHCIWPKRAHLVFPGLTTLQPN